MHHAWAAFAGVQAHRAVDYADLRADPGVLAAGGWWAIVAEFDGPWHAWRFAEVTRTPRVARDLGSGWAGPPADSWKSSMSHEAYLAAVARVREDIRAGEVYQANVCRVLSARLPKRPDAGGLAQVLATGNPAPYAGVIDVPDGVVPGSPGAWVVSASPELGVQVADGVVSSGPIKGTAPTPDLLQDKDRAENVMITDLVRNDLQHVCQPGTVTVTDLLALEHHPGLVHLVSRVSGRLRPAPLRASRAAGWAALLAAAHPPGSVSGAPKSSALRIIEELETVPRGPYCGQVGWIDADAEQACLAVGIRTFWWSDGVLRFGTGAGITFDSDPQTEWEETELKAATLLRLASRQSLCSPPPAYGGTVGT